MPRRTPFARSGSAGAPAPSWGAPAVPPAIGAHGGMRPARGGRYRDTLCGTLRTGGLGGGGVDDETPDARGGRSAGAGGRGHQRSEERRGGEEGGMRAGRDARTA